MTEPALAGESVAGRHEPHLSYIVARLERALRAEINERVKPYGLTTLQYTTLSILGPGGELSNAQLARRAYMTPQSMSEVLDALERNGLIERNAHPNHRRVFPAVLTAEGRKVLDKCNAAVDELEREMLADLTTQQVKSLRHGLLSAVRALHAGFPQSDYQVT
jgi:DNA-binding MarR family transcriptional regulator